VLRGQECYRCEWLGDGVGDLVGRRFRGKSRTGLMRWAKTCEVTAAEPGSVFAFRTIATTFSPSSTEWRFDLAAQDGGTWVVESYSIKQVPPRPLMAMIAVLARHHLDLTPDLDNTLARLDEVLS
jgi:hypothetical protein